MADTTLKERPVKNAQDRSRLTMSEVQLLFNLHREGLTQSEIAQRLGCNQPTVSKWLATLIDTTGVAKEYLRGSALRMAKNVVTKGQARDHIQALKGIGVLESERQDIQIAIGVSLPGMSMESSHVTVAPPHSPLLEDTNHV